MLFKLPNVALGVIFCCLAPHTLANSLLSWPQLTSLCQAADPQSQAQCRGYIMGVADAGALCIPQGIKPTTLQDLALSTINEESIAPAQAIQKRLQAVFPCPNNAGKTPAAEQPAAESAPTNENWSNKKRIGK